MTIASRSSAVNAWNGIECSSENDAFINSEEQLERRGRKACGAIIYWRKYINDSEMYIFGYGSLVYKSNFAYEEEYIGYIEGWVRRFWQLSTDHRGVPGKPGRVVTLIPFPQYKERFPDEHVTESHDIVWGKCYKIHADNVEAVREYLDYREKNGYELHTVTVTLATGEKLENVLVYIGTCDNSEFGGVETCRNIAMQILDSTGPSGPNRDYLFMLGEALKQQFPPEALQDVHLQSLLKHSLELLSKSSPSSEDMSKLKSLLA